MSAMLTMCTNTTHAMYSGDCCDISCVGRHIVCDERTYCDYMTCKQWLVING